MQAEGRARARVRVRGRVQGVFFRAETEVRAGSLGLDGWVKNTSEGAVEAVFEGAPAQVDSMIEWCGRGPAGAEVEQVQVEREQPRGESGFRVC